MTPELTIRNLKSTVNMEKVTAIHKSKVIAFICEKTAFILKVGVSVSTLPTCATLSLHVKRD